MLLKDISYKDVAKPVAILVQTTSGYRPITPEDFTTVSLEGATVNVSAVTSKSATTVFNAISGLSGEAFELVAPNSNRVGLYLYNNTDQPLKCRFGGTPTATEFSFCLPSSGCYEMPKDLSSDVISGICDGNPIGLINITELVI